MTQAVRNGIANVIYALVGLAGGGIVWLIGGDNWFGGLGLLVAVVSIGFALVALVEVARAVSDGPSKSED